MQTIHIDERQFSADQYEEELLILQRVGNQHFMIAQYLPASIKFVEQHVFRDIFNNVITVQLFQDTNWGEFRIRNIVNEGQQYPVDTVYKQEKVETMQRVIRKQVADMYYCAK